MRGVNFSEARARLLVAGAMIGCIYSGSALAGVQQVQIQLPATANASSSPYHSVSIPLTVYAAAKDSQLSDLRVRNAAGEYLSYAWLTTPMQQLQIQTQKVPVFPLAVASPKSDDNLNIEIERRADGSLQWRAQTTSSKRAVGVEAWLIDASALQRQAQRANTSSHLVQARLNVADDFQGVAGFTLDISDDLQHWQSLDAHFQILQLRHQGERLQQLEIALPAVQANYLRLKWDQSSTAPAIKSLQLDAQQQNWSPSTMLWAAPVKPSLCDANMCEYHVPTNLPLDSVKVRLPQTNTLARMALDGVFVANQIDHHHLRHSLNPLYVLRYQKRNTAPNYQQEHHLQDFMAYRLLLDGKEVESEAIALNGFAYSRLRLRIPAGFASLGVAPPQLEFGSIARSLVFLARGEGPYRIEWGQEVPQGAALDMPILMPKEADAKGFSSGASLLIAPSPIALTNQVDSKAVSHVQSASTIVAQRKIWLWSALLLAVVLLGWMVWSSLGQIDKSSGKASNTDKVSEDKRGDKR